MTTTIKFTSLEEVFSFARHYKFGLVQNEEGEIVFKTGQSVQEDGKLCDFIAPPGKDDGFTPLEMDFFRRGEKITWIEDEDCHSEK